MDGYAVAHAELKHDGQGILCGEVIMPGEGQRELTGDAFTAWATAHDGPILTYGGRAWAEAAGIGLDRLVDLNETFGAANGFKVQLLAFGPLGRSVAETVCALRERLLRCGRLEWETRAGQRRAFWVPNFGCPVAQLYYAPSPFSS